MGVRFKYEPLSPARTHMKYAIFFAFLLFLPLVSAKVVINEIMYNPIGADDDFEWLELYNDGTTAVDVSSYKIDGTVFDDAIIPPNGYLVVAKKLQGNTSFASIYGDKDGVWNASDSFAAVDGAFTLTNTGKTLSLTDGNGVSRDTISYTNSFANENNKTLERTNSINTNLKESLSNGGTPGMQNTVFNSAPVLGNVIPEKTEILIGEDKIQTFSATITDAQNNVFVTWAVDGMTKGTISPFSFNASEYTIGKHTILLTVSDGEFTQSKIWNVTTSDVPVSQLVTLSYNASQGLQKAKDLVLSTSLVKVDFGSQEIDLHDIVDVDAGLKITQDTVGIDTVLFPQLAKNATISFSGLSLSNPVILTSQSLSDTPTTICTSCVVINKTPVSFTIPTFSQYKVVEYDMVFSLALPSTITVSATKGETATKEITITNNGLQPVTEILVSFTPENGYDINISGGKQIGLFSLAVGEKKVFSLSTLIPFAQDVKNLRLGTLSVSAKEVATKTIPVTLSLASKLVFSDITVKVDENAKRHVSDGSSIAKVRPGSTITFTTEIANAYTSAENRDLDDITVEVIMKGIENDGDDLDEDVRISSLGAGDTEKKKIEFTLPIDIEDKTYVILVTATGIDEFNQEHTAKASMKLVVEKELHDLRIIRMDITNQECSKHALVEVLFKNLGRNDEDDVRVEILGQGIDFEKNMKLTDDSGEKSEFLFSTSLDVPEAGSYPVTARISRDHDRLEDEQTVTLTGQCEEKQSEDDTEGEETHHIIINNPFVKKINEAVQKQPEQSPVLLYAATVGALVLLIIMLLFLAVQRRRY